MANHCIVARRNQLILDSILVSLLVAAVLVPLLLPPAISPVLQATLIAGSFVVVLIERIRLRRFAIRRLLRSNFDPDAIAASNSELRQTVEMLGSENDGNVVVYSGFTPFVGSGINLRGFSFVVDLSRGKESPLAGVCKPQVISVAELYDELTTEIRKLDFEGLKVEENVYVNGKDVRNLKAILDNPLKRPINKVAPERFSAAMKSPGRSVRYYRSIRVVAWEGELVSSAFLRFANSNNQLFVEANFFLLCPIAEKYRTIDSWNRPIYWRDVVEITASSLALTIPYLLRPPFSIGSLLTDTLLRGHRRRRLEREVLRNPDFDYGAPRTIRELGSTPEFRRYFQKLDNEMFQKLLEKRILDSVVDSLDRRDIDTSEIKQRQTAILNSGVIVTGGSVTAESIAAGTGSMGIVNRITSVARTTANSLRPAQN